MRSALTAAFAAALSLSPLLATAEPATTAAMRVSDVAAEVLSQAGTCDDQKQRCPECEKGTCDGCQDGACECDAHTCDHHAKKHGDRH